MSEAGGSDGLKIKSTGSITGGVCCPSCGGLLPSASAVRCPHCQALVAKEPSEIRPQRGGPGIASVLFSFIAAFFRGLLWLVLIAVVAFAGTYIYKNWWPQIASSIAIPFLSGDSPSISKPATVSGNEKCPTCAGTGKIDGPVVNTPCEQCKGTGIYHMKLKEASVKCPFCRGTGIKESHRPRIACTTCGGTGIKPVEAAAK